MLFKIVESHRQVPDSASDRAYLVVDGWNDWFKYETMFALVIFDRDGKRHDPGYVKIGQRGLLPGPSGEPGTRSPDLPKEFESLGDSFFSLGQDDTYYETVGGLSDDLAKAIFVGLRDCANDLSIFESACAEDVMTESLLRGIPEKSVRRRFNCLAHKNAVLTEYHFEYTLPNTGHSEPPVLSFDVDPDSEPPTNVHVLIGRNGVGKTRCMRSLALAISSQEQDAAKTGSVIATGLHRHDWAFAGLVLVSFSPFDGFDSPSEDEEGQERLRIQMIGLPVAAESAGAQESDATDSSCVNEAWRPQTLPDRLAETFCRSFGKCRRGLRRDRWRSAIETLENDPLFAEAHVAEFLDLSADDWFQTAKRQFGRLSSGHAIVLLTITRLVELLNEQTIVLIDEPEGHLHPPLLSAFVRALSDLLVKRNGIAIIATHSPVVLQEVPRSCVWMLRRSGYRAVAERPSIETFGENVGTLTGEVFGLEVTNSGFHELLKRAAKTPGKDYDSIIADFGGQLGAEAQLILRSLLAIRNRNEAEGR